MEEIKKIIIIGGIAYVLGFPLGVVGTALLLKDFYDVMPSSDRASMYMNNTIKYFLK